MSKLIIVEFGGWAAGDPSTKLGMTKNVRLIGQDDSDTDSDPDFLKGQGLLIRVDSCAFPPEAWQARSDLLDSSPSVGRLWHPRDTFFAVLGGWTAGGAYPPG